MTEIKTHLKSLHRTKPDKKSRMDYLRLNMNEGVPGLPGNFIKKIASGITPEFLAAYPECEKLRKKIAAKYGLKPENIGLSNGSDGAIKHIFDAYISEKDKVLVTDPTFAMYPVYCKMLNAEAVTVPYGKDLSFPQKEFIAGLSRDIKMAVIVNPNNPAGSKVGRERLIAIIKKCRKNKILLIVDEAYFYFCPESVIKEIKKYKNLVVLRTFSKLCGMASARLGYIAADAGIVENISKVRPTYDVNGFAALFAERLLDKPSVIKKLVASAKEGERYLSRKLLKNGIEHKRTEANFILIKCGTRVKKITERLAKKKVLVADGFRQSGLKDYIRVTIGGKPLMEKFWKIFINIWNA